MLSELKTKELMLCLQQTSLSILRESKRPSKGTISKTGVGFSIWTNLRCFFAKMAGRSLRTVVTPENIKPVQVTVRTNENLELVTIMPVVSASGSTYTPVMVFPGKQPHFRRVEGQIQTVNSFLPPCYFYQRAVPGVDNRLIFDSAQKFVAETTELRKNSQYLLLIIDGFAGHVQFNTLQYFKENRIIVLAMPAHSSHRLQPLDVSVFLVYKSYMQREIDKFSRSKKVLDTFDIALCICDAYTASHNTGNIVSGFRKAGIWDESILGHNVKLLKQYLTNHCKDEIDSEATLESLLKTYQKMERSLLRDADIEEQGTVKIHTTRGCNLTSDAVLQALEIREQKKRDQLALKQEKEERRLPELDYKEKASDIAHLIELSSEGAKRRLLMNESRYERRWQQKVLVKRRLFASYGNSQGPLGLGTEEERQVEIW